MEKSLIYKNEENCKFILNDRLVTKTFREWIDGAVNYYNYQNYKEYENKMWYSGDIALLKRFYHIAYGDLGELRPSENYFWRNASGKISMVHMPVASSISEIMSSILFSENPDIKIDNEIALEEVNKIYEYNNFAEFLQTGAQLESYSGTIACKINIDDRFDYPLLKWYPAERIQLKKIHNKVVEVCFDDFYCDGYLKEYNLKTYYGFGYIRYKLFDDNGNQVEIDKLEETKDLKDIQILDNNGKPIKKLMCVYKQNRVANNTFDSLKGSSDYDGLTSVFDSIDETASALVDLVKKSRVYTFIPEALQKQNKKTGDVLEYDVYGVDVYSTEQRERETLIKLPQRDYFQIVVAPYIECLNQLIKSAINRVGISPSSFGMDDAGANASGEALNIRDKGTEKTYNDKSKLWIKALIDLSELLLIYNDLMKNDNVIEKDDAYIFNVDIESYDNLEINVTFAEYKKKTLSETLSEYVDAIDNGLITREWVVNNAFKDLLTEEDLNGLKTELNINNEETGALDG